MKQGSLCLTLSARGVIVLDCINNSHHVPDDHKVKNVMACIQNDFICIDEGVSIQAWVEAIDSALRMHNIIIDDLKKVVMALFNEDLIGTMLTQSAMDILDDEVEEFNKNLMREVEAIDREAH